MSTQQNLLASRKFITCLCVQFANIILLTCDKLPADKYEFLTMIIFGGYVGGNVAAKAIKNKEINIKETE